MNVMSADQPIMDLNTTPLIDVMLVLLVMFVITIPIQTHAIKLDLPVACPTCPRVDAKANTITISRRDQLAWNGTPISNKQLGYMLWQTQRMQPAPELHLRPDPDARYEVVDEVLGVIKREQVKKFGFVGNEAYANW